MLADSELSQVGEVAFGVRRLRGIRGSARAIEFVWHIRYTLENIMGSVTNAHTHIHTGTRTHPYNHTRTHIHTCTHTQTYPHMHIHKYTHTDTYTHACTQIRMHTHIQK